MLFSPAKLKLHYQIDSLKSISFHVNFLLLYIFIFEFMIKTKLYKIMVSGMEDKI